MIASRSSLDAGLLDQNVPRYASYPTVAQFHEGIGADQFDDWIGDLRPGTVAGVYLHVPFCRQICWFCVCRTQSTASQTPLRRYAAALEAEIDRAAARLPAGVRVDRMHWGGGSPAILPPEFIDRLAERIRGRLAGGGDLAFSAEIDPRNAGGAALDALAGAGLTAATIGVQDFDPAVQRAIGRLQSRAETAACAAGLRARGVTTLAVDMMYGLPFQTADSLARATKAVLALEPDRVSIVGYAHVPWMAKRQRMIAEDRLPDTVERLRQAEVASALLHDAGFVACGIDHFARPDDALARAASDKRMRRDFTGYAPDAPDALIGIGASAISRFPKGYVQNALQTSGYFARIEAGFGAGRRGVALTLEDQVRGRAIESVMCGFGIDLARLRDEFGDFATLVQPGIATALERFGRRVRFDGTLFEIVEEAPVLARLVARLFDACSGGPQRHSQAI